MNPTNGQIKVINKLQPTIDTNKVKILCEAGSEKENWYLGTFFIEFKQGRTKKRLKINTECLAV